MIWRFLLQTGFFVSLVANALLFVPQAIKLYRLKRAEEVSCLMFFGFNIIQAFTTIHAYLEKDILLFIGTFLAFITCGTVTCLAFIYRLRN